MDPESTARIRQWKAEMEAAYGLDLEERRNRTPAERMRLLQARLEECGRDALARQAEPRRMPYREVQARLRDFYAKRTADLPSQRALLVSAPIVVVTGGRDPKFN